MILDAEWLRADGPRAVMGMLAAGGHGAWFVGGCVRNALLGRAVDDIDITTDARPERVMALAEAAGMRAVPTGLDHGTVTLVTDDGPLEITTLRRDVATDGRHAVVAFTDRLDEDAARRDFTMNALYADASGTLRDPTGAGLSDLAARRLRFIGDPEARIAEDYLRILRFFRFHALYADPEGGLDADGLAACAAHADGLDRISRERIGAEMMKLLAAPDPAPALAAMGASGVLARVLPGADPDVLARLVALEEASATGPDAVRRLAALAGPEAAGDLRLSRKVERAVAELRGGIESGAGAGELGYRLGPERARDALLLRAAATATPLDPAALAEVLTGAKAVFPVKAADLMPRFSGPELGRELTRLEARWIASGFALDKGSLLS